MFQTWVGMWALRRAVRLLTADDPRPLDRRIAAEGKRIVIGAAITLALLVTAAIVLFAIPVRRGQKVSALAPPSRSLETSRTR
jgi:hypothetical protein